jgi:hypothetical protein
MGSCGGSVRPYRQSRSALPRFMLSMWRGCWNDLSYSAVSMNPPFQSARSGRARSSEFSPAQPKFPRTEYFFQSEFGEWRGHSSPYDGQDGSELRNFHSLSRKMLRVSAREYLAEMVVFGLVVLASGWLVVYMMMTVVRLLSRGHP